jgi:hypothetical protein
MEWQIPIQKVEIGNIHIGQPYGRQQLGSNAGTTQQKPMVPLSYFGTQFRMPFMSVLFPPLHILEYNPTTGRLVLDMGISPLACIKLNTLQETIMNAIVYHQSTWFGTHFTKEEVKDGFQQIIEGNHIVLHFYTGAKGGSSYTPIYRAAGATGGSNAAPTSTSKASHTQLTANDLRPGQRIRVGVKIHGISFLTNATGAWTGRCRLQHRIQGVIALA